MQETLGVNIETIASLFVNRSDVYAVQTDDGAWVLVHQPLTHEVLLRHLEGKLTAGAYQLDERNEVKWICFDFDGENAEQDATKMFLTLMCTEYARASLLEHTGGRGYHVWVFLKNRIPAGQAKKIAEKLAKEAGVQPEVFPKQTRLEQGRFGNLVRLPLGVHKKTGMRSKLVEPDDLTKIEPVFVEPEVEDAEKETKQTAGDSPPCWESMSAGVPERCRNEAAYAMARRLRSQYGWDEGLCLKALVEWNRKNSPPMSEAEVAACVRSAYSMENPAIGCAQIKSNGILTRFCDEERCPWNQRLCMCVCERPRNHFVEDSIAPKCKLNDDSTVEKYFVLILEALSVADSTMTRCYDAEASRPSALELDKTELRRSWSEEELMRRFDVSYIKNPHMETIIFANASFIGTLRIINRKKRNPYPQHVWFVRFLHVDGSSVETSWPGLLTITPRRFRKAGLEDPVSAYPGVTLIVADKDRWLTEVCTNLKERIEHWTIR